MKDTNEQMEGYQGFCPFLYGLSQKAIAFNGFANGKRTIEGVPAVFGGMPVLFDKSYVESYFSNNYFVSPVKILHSKGYNTLFFHGAKNGSMNIENYCYSIGFGQCFGKSEYPNPDDWDGTWGISDRSYLHYVAKVLDTVRQPFFTGILTLSTHHPFAVPNDSKDLNLPQNVHPMMTCVNYVDHGLKEFFDIVSQYSWYDSTLFIITADHTGAGSLPANADRYAMYQIPLLFFHPLAKQREESGQMMQQIDVMPSVFSYLKIDTPLFSYGRNVFDKNSLPCAVNYLSGVYQFFTPEFALQFDGEKTIGFYPLPDGIGEGKNVTADYPKEKQASEQKMKALIESYTTRMSRNMLYINEKTWKSKK
jgi:phosphoglycerol transferase MdoB-like AlkP superfamily enzyme